MNPLLRNLILSLLIIVILSVSGCTEQNKTYNVYNSQFDLGTYWEADNINKTNNGDAKTYYSSFNYTGSKIGRLIVTQYPNKSSFDQIYEKELYVTNHLNWTISKNETIDGVHVNILEDKVVSGLGRTINYFFIKNGKYYSVLILSQDPYDDKFQKSIKTILSTLN